MYKKLLGLFCASLIGYGVVFAQVGTRKFSGKPIKADSTELISSIDARTLKKLDPLLRNFMRVATDKTAAKQARLQALQKPKSPINLERTSSGDVMVWVLIKTTNAAATRAEVQRQGGMVTTVAGDILVAKVPGTALGELARGTAVRKVAASTKLKPLLDASRTEIKADKVQSGTDLARAYTGSGVVVGVVDSGIDETHEDFKTSSGSRILYLWDISGSGNGPYEFNYGREYTKAQIDAGQCLESDANGHGTHVAGTAAGNGRTKNGFTGIAPESDIVFVKGFKAGSEGFADNDVINGCNYIFLRAAALGKPAVVNLSLGGHFGPHDGTGFFEEALSNLTGQGKIIVAAAGNEGSDLIHLGYATSGSSYDSAPETLLDIPSGTTDAYIDIWYPASSNISFGVAGYNSSGDVLFNTEPVVAGESSGNISTGYGTASVDATETSADTPNGMNRVVVELTGTDLSQITWSLYTFGSGTFDAWFAAGGSFSSSSNGYLRAGDNNKSVGMPATGKKIICVGAYTTKNSWTDVNGSTWTFNPPPIVGQIASFSSRGPSLDGRIKPDITAPGQVIGAALSQDITSPDSRLVLEGGKMLIEQGTSMASPHVAGALALLLGYYPSLDYDGALDILKTTARKDSYTGSSQNNTWGAGKMDVLAAMQSLITSGTGETGTTKPLEFALGQNYPNPFNPVTTIQYTIPSTAEVKLKVFDLLGREIRTLVNERKPSGSYEVHFDGASLASGVYFYRLMAGNYVKTKKMVLVK